MKSRKLSFDTGGGNMHAVAGIVPAHGAAIQNPRKSEKRVSINEYMRESIYKKIAEISQENSLKQSRNTFVDKESLSSSISEMSQAEIIDPANLF